MKLEGRRKPRRRRPTATACRSRRPSRSARPARRSTACASSTSPTCSRARPARSCSPIWAPTCIKVERPGVGDITRGQLRDVQRRGQPLLHDAQRQQALDHDRLQAPQGQGDPRPADQALRRAGGEFRARRARPHGADLGAHPQDQPAHDRRLGEGLRPRPLRGLQGLRERRAMRRRLGLDHRLPRGPAAGHRRADRRLRHRPASRLRHRGALYQRIRTGRGQKRAVRHAGRRAQSRARQAARPAAPRARAAHRIQPVRRGRPVRQGGAARRQRLPAAASPAGSSSARAGRPIPTPTSISSPRRRCGARSAT